MGHIFYRYQNPYKPFTKYWWDRALNLNDLWWDIKDAWQRAFRGWADGDICDMNVYHAGITLQMLRHFKDNHVGYDDTDGCDEDAYEAKLDLAIDAWQAYYDFLTDTGWDYENQSLEEFREPLLKRWEAGKSAFLEIHPSLWN